MLTIREIIKTFYNALLQRFKKYRGNWEQNDPTADDYIKNRPFYSKSANITIDNTVDVQLEGFPIFEVGDTVIVNVDGMEHSLIAYDDRGDITIGDSYDSLENGEGKLGWQIYIWNESVLFHSIKAHTVSYFGEKIVKLDKKYLPENLATKSEVETAQTSANNAQTSANNAQTSANNAQTSANNAQTTAENVSQKTRAFSSSNASKTITITRDNPRVGYKANASFGYRGPEFYLSYEGDALPTIDTLVGSSYIYKYPSGKTSEFSVTEDDIFVSDQGDKAIFINEVGLIATEAGTYTFSKYIADNARAILDKRGIYLVFNPQWDSYICSFNFVGIFSVAEAGFGSDGLSLYSSSGKEFRITVDDSGTLTATEVTT